ncbi:EamA family transporter [Undibacterium arcticum]|uniref:EamA family transporter n=2 Tax=Undibacterium arcticum TaxID=1762892 RepID=A0ABV7FAG8_9BURK
MRIEMIYGLVLVAALAHALWNSIVKGSQDHLLMLGAIRSVGLLVGGIVACFVPLPAAASLPFLLTAAAVHYVYYACMLNAYRLGDLGQVYPISRGMAPLVVTILGIVIAGEYLDGWKLAAIFLISTGLLSLSFSRGKPPSKAIAFAIATGLTIAGYTFLSGLGIRLAGSALSYIAWLEIAAGAGVVIAATVRRRSTAIEFARSHWRIGMIAGMLSVGAYGISLWAMTRLPMAPVAALRETSVIFASLIGVISLKEKFSLPRFAAACSVAVGIIVLTSPHAA